MRVFYTPRYYADIGEGHVFPIRKFELVRDRLLAEGTLRSEGLTEPEPASLDDVLLVIRDTVEIHCNTIRIVKKIFEKQGEPASEGVYRLGA
jgi:hypothetical protein